MIQPSLQKADANLGFFLLAGEQQWRFTIDESKGFEMEAYKLLTPERGRS